MEPELLELVELANGRVEGPHAGAELLVGELAGLELGLLLLLLYMSALAGVEGRDSPLVQLGEGEGLEVLEGRLEILR